MTEEELKKVPFREACHMAMEGEYTTTYMSKDGRLGFCNHVPRDKYGMVKTGGHSFFAEAVVDNTIDNQDLADKIAARTGFKAYEAKAIIEAIADIVAEETLENNRIVLANNRGTRANVQRDRLVQVVRAGTGGKGMITPLRKRMMAQLGIGTSLSPSDLLDKIPVETVTKIVYIPIIVSRAAFEYADFACMLCAEKRLDFRKYTRTIKEQVAEYERMTVGLVGRDIQEFLEGSVDSSFDEAHDHITKLQMAVQQEMKKQWPELTDYSLLLNLYMCVILIDFVRRFEQASSKVIQKATMNPYVAIENENMLHIRKACIEIAGKYKLPNTDMIRLGVKILEMNIDRMVNVEFD